MPKKKAGSAASTAHRKNDNFIGQDVERQQKVQLADGSHLSLLRYRAGAPKVIVLSLRRDQSDPALHKPLTAADKNYIRTQIGRALGRVALDMDLSCSSLLLSLLANTSNHTSGRLLSGITEHLGNTVLVAHTN